MIEVEGLSKRHGRENGPLALRDVTFTVEEGSVLGVLGYDGAGKTTLLRVLATLTRPTKGRVAIGGLNVVAHPQAVKALFGYVPERFEFHRNTNVERHLDFWGRMDGLSRSERESRVEELLTFLELAEIASEPLLELTTNDAQRVALAQALLSDPPLLLLDEPLTPLLPRERHKLTELLQRLNQSGKTLLLTANLLEEVEGLCSKIVLLDSGRSSRALQTPELLKVIGTHHHARIFVQAPDYPDALISALKGLDPVVDVEKKGTALTAFVYPTRGIEDEFRKLFEEEGVPVDRIKSAEIPLGDVFRSLVGREES